ncbi:MAG: hypothetical protein ACJ8F1_18765, partial [Polyangia bacterium]
WPHPYLASVLAAGAVLPLLALGAVVWRLQGRRWRFSWDGSTGLITAAVGPAAALAWRATADVELAWPWTPLPWALAAGALAAALAAGAVLAPALPAIVPAVPVAGVVLAAVPALVVVRVVAPAAGAPGIREVVVVAVRVAAPSRGVAKGRVPAVAVVLAADLVAMPRVGRSPIPAASTRTRRLPRPGHRRLGLPRPTPRLPRPTRRSRPSVDPCASG